MQSNALVVNDLTKKYPDFVLDKVSFSVPCGTIVGLIGENGAGKSTTINAVLGMISRDSEWLSSCTNSKNISKISSRTTGSRPLVASSKIRSLELCDRAAAICSRYDKQRFRKY